MSPQLWIGVIGTVILLGFILNGVRLARGPKGHAWNAGVLQAAICALVLPVMWMIVMVSDA
jgi:hypothetical protein